MTTQYPTLKNLVDAMTGTPTTNQWDVVCSYDQQHLNELLKTRHRAGVIAKEVKLSYSTRNPLTDEPFTIAYDLFFDSPNLSFMKENPGHCLLEMPIDHGSYSIIPDGQKTPLKTVQLPARKFSVIGTIPLAAVSGTTDDAPTEPGNVIAFSDQPEQQHVVIHFRNPKGATYKIVPEPDPADRDPMVTYFLPVLKNYFTNDVEEVDYSLAQINNSPNTSEGLFTPASFVFTSMQTGDLGVLSLYIQTKESGNPAGNPTPSFQPPDGPMLPIPCGYTASLILSNALVQSFLAKQFTAAGFTPSFDSAPKGGIKARLTKDCSIVAADSHGHYLFGGYDYRGLNISLKDHAMEFTLADGKIVITWGGKTQSDWSDVRGGVATNFSVHYGTVDVNISLNLSPFEITVKDNQICMPTTIAITQKDFVIKTRAHGCSWWAWFFGGCTEKVPSFYSKDMKLTLPSLSLSFPGLDFFLETNLISPGGHVVTIDAKAGVKTPHDFLLVGHLAGGGASLERARKTIR